MKFYAIQLFNFQINSNQAADSNLFNYNNNNYCKAKAICLKKCRKAWIESIKKDWDHEQYIKPLLEVCWAKPGNQTLL